MTMRDDNRPRVEVARTMIGLCHMQVCCVSDATDDEILEVCNRENMSGTSGGWSTVVRVDSAPDDFWQLEGPVPCEDHEGRIHVLVGC